MTNDLNLRAARASQLSAYYTILELDSPAVFALVGMHRNIAEAPRYGERRAGSWIYRYTGRTTYTLLRAIAISTLMDVPVAIILGESEALAALEDGKKEVWRRLRAGLPSEPLCPASRVRYARPEDTTELADEVRLYDDRPVVLPSCGVMAWARTGDDATEELF